MGVPVLDIEDAVNWVLSQRLIEQQENNFQRPQTLLPDPSRVPLAALQQPFVQYRDRSREEVRKSADTLSRDQRLEIRVLKKHFPDLTYYNLMERTGASFRQVQRALHGPPTPQKKGRGGLKLLTEDQRQALIRFLYANEEHREIPWRDLRLMVPEIASFGECSITRIMRDLGFKRRKRGRTRLELTAADHQLRADLARQWLERWPTLEAWLSTGPIFSDETYATTKPVFDRWLTVHECEDPFTFELLRKQGYSGWMFWDQIQGIHKGPCYIWPKGEGGISAEKYCNRILLLVREFQQQLGFRAVFQHDGARSHTAYLTRRTLQELRIETLQWPRRSPDLNPIENVWAWMKNYLESTYDLQKLSERDLYNAIKEAWEAVPVNFLRMLAVSAY